MYFKVLRWHKMIAFIEVRILHVLLMRLAWCCLMDHSFEKGERHLAFNSSSFPSPAANNFTLPGMYKWGLASVRFTKLINVLLTCAWVKSLLEFLESFAHGSSGKMWTYQKVSSSNSKEWSNLEILIKRRRKIRAQLSLRGGRINMVQIYQVQS